SVGLTNFELGQALVRLGAVTGMALDGGGSTTMAYDGRLLNRPSGPSERAIATGLVFEYTGVFLPDPAPLVSPDGDGVHDTQALSYRVVRPSAVTVTLTRPDGSVASTEAGDRDPGAYPLAFPPAAADATAAEEVAEGRWTLTARAVDDVGRPTTMKRVFVVNSTLGFVRPDPAVLRLPPAGAPFTVRFRLTRAARVGVAIERADGTAVRGLATRATPAGEGSVTWNGLGRDRKPVAAGSYVVRVTATNALGRVEQTAAFRVRRVAAG
ncbi:MAG TPA: FlgD immunoglobulin-like domain containing protein, partial [Candidatus Limnocylindrales bacterium]